MNSMFGNEIVNTMNETFFIEKLIFTPLTKQPAIFSRPYVLNSNAQIPNLIAGRMERSNGHHVSGSSISDISAEIIRPSAVGYETEVNDSWMKQDRLNFIMKVVSISLGTKTNTYIQGYTNHNGVNDLGFGKATCAPEMMFNTTSVIETVGEPGSEQIHRAYDVIRDNSINGVSIIRPDDVISKLKVKKAMSVVAGLQDDWGNMISPEMRFNGVNSAIVNGSSINTRFSEYADIINVANSVGNNYVSRVLNHGIDEMFRERTIDTSTNNFDIQISSSSHNVAATEEKELRRNRFLSFISVCRGDMAPTGVFCYGDLMKIHPHGADNFIYGRQVSNSIHMAFSETPHVGGGEYWHGRSGVTVAAQSMLQTAISIASSKGFQHMIVSFSNLGMVMFGQNVIIRDSTSYIDTGPGSIMTLLEMARHAFQHDFFTVESMGGTIPLSGTVYVDLTGDSKIHIDTYRDPVNTWYTLPTTANRHIVPTIGSDFGLIDTTTDSLGNLIDQITRGIQ